MKLKVTVGAHRINLVKKISLFLWALRMALFGKTGYGDSWDTRPAGDGWGVEIWR